MSRDRFIEVRCQICGREIYESFPYPTIFSGAICKCCNKRVCFWHIGNKRKSFLNKKKAICTDCMKSKEGIC